MVKRTSRKPKRASRKRTSRRNSRHATGSLKVCDCGARLTASGPSHDRRYTCGKCGQVLDSDGMVLRAPRKNSRKRTSRRNRRHSWSPSVMRRNSRLSKKRRSKLPASKFVFPKDRAWPIESAKGARDAIRYMKMGRVRSGADYLDIRNFIIKHYPAVWRKYGFNSSWPRTQAAKKKGMAHRRASMRTKHKMAANTRRRRR